MTASSQKQDGMGSLHYPDNTARFRVWAPFASGVNVVLFDPGPGTTTVALANEPGTPNWSADGIPAVVNTRYQYVITTAPGQDNDTSLVHWRTDARALQVEGSASTARGYVVDPLCSPRTALRSRRRPSRIFSSTNSTSDSSRAAMTASTGSSQRPTLSNSRIAFLIYEI